MSYLDPLGFSDDLVLTFSLEVTLSAMIPSQLVKHYSKVMEVDAVQMTSYLSWIAEIELSLNLESKWTIYDTTS